jgi:hypothetical protein
MTIQADRQSFARIIQQGLAGRRSRKAKGHHPELNAPLYVVQMCMALTRAIKEAGNPNVTLAEVVRLESTCTGADYLQKLALRSHRLALMSAA